MSFLDIFKIKKIKEENKKLRAEVERLNFILTPEMLDVVQLRATHTNLTNEIGRLTATAAEKNAIVEALRGEVENLESKVNKNAAKVENLATLYKAIKSYIDIFRKDDFIEDELKKINEYIDNIDIKDLMTPTAEIKLHNSDVKDLRKMYRQIDKNIQSIFSDYEKRYTTKSNLAIYRLMVIALRAELQNVLYTMKFGKFENAEKQINEICMKYLKIAAEGNQTIAPTVTKFITETQVLFLDAAKVEYEYYLRKERMKEEQKALREQMKQEAEEQKKLQEEKKKIEAEEKKYTSEIEKLKAQLAFAEASAAQKLEERITELEQLRSEVDEKKATIVKLQNGKAGCVYVISNLGSFGEQMFKIGMTRRLNPQERVDELGSASVPFSFDVHSFIFSDDAASLETQIHRRLNNNRVNKVNLRKEFFNISINELESLVFELDPAAEFNKTMAAEQYRQSLSMSSAFEDFEDESDEDEE